MISRIDDIFRELRRTGRTALMPFLCAGHPSLGCLGDVLLAAEQAGASAVEIGFPFSDPIADGPVIAAAMHEALQLGATPDAIFETIRGIRPRTQLGLVAMVSVSIVNRMGPQRFMDDARRAGFDGVIVPDIPIEEADAIRSLAARTGLTITLLVAPTTPDQRAAAIARGCTGFVYMVARTGITGERRDAPEVAQGVERIRAATDLPVACGFGICTAEHVRAVTEHADAAIVGSALVRKLAAAGDDPATAAGDFIAELAQGLSTRT
ncbi:MAG: tryptophan synthase subunit alpha [Phycisphaerales bacterium]|nr:tryptophan synthase subunit alpha [Phycisphaerales bacterium]